MSAPGVPRTLGRHPALLRLVVLDLNGILLFRAPSRGTAAGVPRPAHRRHDLKQGQNYIYVRPHATEFLSFLLEKFHVAVWSSAAMKNVHGMLNLFPAYQRKQLAFVWAQPQCWAVPGGVSTENPNKPLFLKLLSHIYDEPSFRGIYDHTNTILLDDSPEKASGNQPQTSYHPQSYDPNDQFDDALSDRGSLRILFERLSRSQRSIQDFLHAHYPQHITNEPPADSVAIAEARQQAQTGSPSRASQEAGVGRDPSSIRHDHRRPRGRSRTGTRLGVPSRALSSEARPARNGEYRDVQGSSEGYFVGDGVYEHSGGFYGGPCSRPGVPPAPYGAVYSAPYTAHLSLQQYQSHFLPSSHHWPATDNDELHNLHADFGRPHDLPKHQYQALDARSTPQRFHEVPGGTCYSSVDKQTHSNSDGRRRTMRKKRDRSWSPDRFP